MAGGTSVGLITLDLEIRSSIQKQLEKIVSGVGRQTKDVFDGAFKRVGESAASAMEKPLKQAEEAMKRPLKRAKEQVLQTEEEIDAIVKRAMDRLNSTGKSNKPETLRVTKRTPSKLATDPEAYMQRWDPEKLKLRETEQKIDKVQKKVSQASASAKAVVKKAAGEIRGVVAQTAEHARKKVKTSTGWIQKTLGKLGKMIQSVFKAVFLTSALYAAFRGLKSLLEGATTQSKDFSKALNNVKANLAIAFQPIIDAVMPALTALMQGLANVTKSIAAFIAGLFGKTYSQAAEAAKKLQQVKAGADKAKGSLAGFDELNVIGDKSGESSGVDFEAIDTSGTEAAEGLGAKAASALSLLGSTLNDFLRPIISWFVENGLPRLMELGAELSRTFVTAFFAIQDVCLTVWDGVLKPVSNFIATVLKDICDIVLDLWDKYGAKTLENIRAAIESTKNLFQTLWDNFLGPIFSNVFGVLTALWEEHLKPLVAQIGEFVMKLINGALEIYNGFIAPVVSWFVEIIGPVISEQINKIVAVIGRVVGVISDVVKEIFKILGGIIDFVSGVFTGDWEKAWNGVSDSLKAVWNGMVAIIEGAINLVIEAINWMIDKVNDIVDKIPDKLFEAIGLGAGWRIPTIGKVELPRLAGGAVIQQPTLAMMGEYAGARSNPEIVSPQSTMRETFLESIIPLLNTLEEGFDRVIEAIRTIDPNLNIDGVELARILAPYLDKESVRRGKTIFQV